MMVGVRIVFVLFPPFWSKEKVFNNSRSTSIGRYLLNKCSSLLMKTNGLLVKHCYGPLMNSIHPKEGESQTLSCPSQFPVPVG